MRVLVVEDDGIIGLMLEDILLCMGHDVCAIEFTEAAAIASAARCMPDLIIVDAHLTEGSGVAALETILLKRFVPHLFVTGDLRAVRLLRPGAIMIEKPFNELELAHAIDRAMTSTASI